MKRILVIDDDSAVMALTTRALRPRGFQTLTAHNGVVGLEMAKTQLPDLIICDIQMPQLNGFETLAALRQDAATAAIPFIFLTGMADRDQVRQGMGLGADDYLTKPFTAQELIGAVNIRLEKQNALRRRSEEKLQDLRGNIGMARPRDRRIWVLRFRMPAWRWPAAISKRSSRNWRTMRSSSPNPARRCASVPVCRSASSPSRSVMLAGA